MIVTVVVTGCLLTRYSDSHCRRDWLFVNIRLIVVAEKKVVYDKFPIPLINRLEKHFLAMDTMLTEDQRQLADHLQHWAEQFCNAGLYHPALQRGIRFLHSFYHSTEPM